MQRFFVTRFSSSTTDVPGSPYVRYLERAQALAPTTVIDAIVAMMTRTTTLTALQNLPVPILMLFGQDDAITPPEQGMRVSLEIDGARLISVPEAGHMVPVESPQFIVEILGNFLAKLYAAQS